MWVWIKGKGGLYNLSSLTVNKKVKWTYESPPPYLLTLNVPKGTQTETEIPCESVIHVILGSNVTSNKVTKSLKRTVFLRGKEIHWSGVYVYVC